MDYLPEQLKGTYARVMGWKPSRKPAYRKTLNIAATIGIVILAVAIPVAYIFLSYPGKTQAAWFNNAWAYRNAIPVSSHTAAEKNVYISVTLDTSASGQFQADCGDLRFTDAGGNRLFYYVVSGCGTATTVVHVYFLSFPAGAQTVYYYYGNPSAPNGLSSGDFATEAASYTIGTVGSQEVGAAPVAYWKFDEGYGTVAHDSIVNNKDGTLSGATKPSWQSKSYCMSGPCLYFEGSAAYVSMAATVKSVKSVSFWVKPKTNGEVLVDLDGGTHYISASAGSITATGFSSPTYYINGIQTTTPTLTANAWQQITVTTGTAFDASAITVGKHSTTYLNGFVDEFKLYDYARSAAQVKTDTVLTGTGSTLGAKATGTDELSNGLVGYWNLNENTSTSVADSSGNGTTGTVSGTSNTPSWAAGKFGSGLSMPGTTGTAEAIAMGDPASGILDFGTNSFTFSVWVNVTSNIGGSDVALYKGGSSGTTTGYDIELGTGAWNYHLSDGTLADYVTIAAAADGTPYLGKWTLLTGVVNRTANTVTSYINGAQTNSASIAALGSVSNAASFGIGATTGGAAPFNGSVDEIRVYNRALSSQEVRQLFDWTPGPDSYWKLDENTGTTAYDSGTNKADATLTNSPAWKPAKFGSGLQFSSSAGSKATVGNGHMNGKQAITLQAWMKRSVTGDDTSIGEENNPGNTGFSMEWYGDNVFYCNIYDGSAYHAASFTPPNDLNWHNFACVFDGSQSTDTTKAVIYMDGIKQSVTITNNVGNMPTSVHADDTAFGISFGSSNALVDDVKMYYYPRTASQVVQDLNAGHPLGGSPIGSQALFLKFDEGSGDTAYDSSPQHLTGDLGGNTNTCPGVAACPRRITDGKYGGGLNFDGTNTYINIGDQTSLEFPNGSDFSISVWVNSPLTATGTVIAKKAADTAANSGYKIRLLSTGAVTFEAADGTNQYQLDTAAGAVPANTWTQITAVYKDTSTADTQLYINGLKVATTATGTLSSVGDVGVNTRAVTVGAESDLQDFYLGKMDNPKMYAAALTPDEVKIDYNRGSSLVLGSISNTSQLATGSIASNSAEAVFCVPGDTATCTAPTYWWKLDENRGTATVMDSSGNGNSGTIDGTAKPLWVPGRNGSALQFDGVDDDITFSWTGGTYATGTLEFSFYLSSKQDNSSTSVVNLFQDNLTGNNNGDIEHIQLTTAGTLQIRTDAGLGAANFSSVQASWNANQWYNITYSWDASNVYLYINGDLDSTFAVGHGLFPSATSTQRYARKDSTYSRVRMDDIRIYPYTRSQAQIAWDYNYGKPVAQWKLNECGGTTIHDSAGNGLDGTLTVGATGTQSAPGTCATTDTATAWYNGATGKYNSALNFDGTDDVVNIYSSGLANMFNASQGSLMTWVKLSSAQLSDTASNRSAVQIAADTSNYVRIIKSSTANTLTINYTAGGTAKGYDYVTTDTNWIHIAITWNVPGNAVKVYINGILRNSSAGPGTWVGAVASTRANIGARLSTATDPFSGLIDDVRLYNYPLTKQQIQTAMNNSGSTRFGPASGTP